MRKLTFIAALLFTTSANADSGEYIARLGDCTSCHTSTGSKPFSGGLPINSPFGVIYSSNITPDKDYGIGHYSLEDFSRAVRKGIAKDGHHLYPAMPYTSFAGASDEDIRAMYEYFMSEVAPVHVKPPETKLSFPFNQRWGIGMWNLLYLNDKPLKPDSNHDALWNRGAYLVETTGHCSACHSPRGIAYDEASAGSSEFLSGQTLDHWHAPNLRADPQTGLGKWTAADITQFLKTGRAHGVAAFGNMAQVVENSTQYLSEQDNQAIASYLLSLADHHHRDIPYHSSTEFEHPGAGLYASSCASCHQPNGTGKPPRFPILAGNPAIVSNDPTSIIRIVLEGQPKQMPAFGQKFNDQEIADVVTFIRQNWGNSAKAVTARKVRKLRAATTPASPLSKSQ